MGIIIGSNFDIGAAVPIDSKTVRAAYSNLASIPDKYAGLEVFTYNDNKKYRYQNDNTWKQLETHNDLLSINTGVGRYYHWIGDEGGSSIRHNGIVSLMSENILQRWDSSPARMFIQGSSDYGGIEIYHDEEQQAPLLSITQFEGSRGDILTVNTNRCIGIGNPNPTHSLEINGKYYQTIGEESDAFTINDASNGTEAFLVNSSNLTIKFDTAQGGYRVSIGYNTTDLSPLTVTSGTSSVMTLEQVTQGYIQHLIVDESPASGYAASVGSIAYYVGGSSGYALYGKYGSDETEWGRFLMEDVSGAVLIGGQYLTFPSSTGSNGYVLKTNGSGALSWGAVSSSQVYKGTWNATTNTPQLRNASGGALPTGCASGWWYRCTTGGTVNFGAGNITFSSGDDVMYDGSIWSKIPAVGYTLQAATASVLGGVMIGTGIGVTSGGTISVSYGSTSSTSCVGNDARLSDSRTASDVYGWAKAATKPTYNYSEVGAEPSISKSVGYLKWTGSAWSFLNESYSLTSHNHSGVYEPVLGNPSGNGYILASTTTGVRSWVSRAEVVGLIGQTENNTFLGEYAGQHIALNEVTQINNVGIGRMSMSSFYIGQDNTVIGSNAGYHMNSSFRNVFIGAWAGWNITTGSNNIIIGANATYSLATTNFSNKLWIDANDVANPLISGDFNDLTLKVNGELEVVSFKDETITPIITSRWANFTNNYYVITKIGNVVFVSGEFSTTANGSGIGHILFRLPEGSRPPGSIPFAVNVLQVSEGCSGFCGADGYVVIWFGPASTNLHRFSFAFTT